MQYYVIFETYQIILLLLLLLLLNIHLVLLSLLLLNLNCIPLLKMIVVFSFLKYYNWVISWRNDAFPIRISKNLSKLSRDVVLYEGKNSLKTSFLQECTSNLVTKLEFELLTESFCTKKKLSWQSLSCNLTWKKIKISPTDVTKT